jgi:hypothetical protein
MVRQHLQHAVVAQVVGLCILGAWLPWKAVTVPCDHMYTTQLRRVGHVPPGCSLSLSLGGVNAKSLAAASLVDGL